MFRYNKKELIAQIKLLPGRDVPAFLEKHKDALAKLRRKDLQQVADTVITAMIPTMKYPKYISFDDDVSYIVKTFGPTAFAAKFSTLVSTHVTAMIPFLERHAQEIAQMYTPEKFLEFLTGITGKIFSEFKDFPLEELNRKLTYTTTHSYRDEDDRLITTGQHDWCPDKGGGYSLPAKVRGNIERYTQNKNLNIMTADQIFELSQRYTENYRRKENKIIIQDMKNKYDAEQLVIAASNFTKASKIIALFADSFSLVSKIEPLLAFMEKLHAIDDRCHACVAEHRARDEYSLVLPFLRTMHRAIKTPADMEAVLKHLELSKRIDFIDEHDVFMNAKKHDHRHGLFAHRANAGDNASHHTSEKVRLTH